MNDKNLELLKKSLEERERGYEECVENAENSTTKAYYRGLATATHLALIMIYVYED